MVIQGYTASKMRGFNGITPVMENQRDDTCRDLYDWNRVWVVGCNLTLVTLFAFHLSLVMCDAVQPQPPKSQNIPKDP